MLKSARFFIKELYALKILYKFDVSIPVPNFNMLWKKQIPFTFMNFGISKFVSDGPNESFLVYTLASVDHLRGAVARLSFFSCLIQMYFSLDPTMFDKFPLALFERKWRQDLLVPST